MKIKELSPTILAALKDKRYDRIVEKHEGPETWDWQLPPSEERVKEMTEMYQHIGYDFSEDSHAEFMHIAGVEVLLPIGSDHHENTTILHHFISEDRQKIVLYIKDTTYDDGMFGAGFIAICDKYPNESFYIATMYHEWFIIDYDLESEE
jgi:hypothetical protein